MRWPYPIARQDSTKRLVLCSSLIPTGKKTYRKAQSFLFIFLGMHRDQVQPGNLGLGHPRGPILPGSESVQCADYH
jgi:hypothetical protein